ncbi:hypothetical protein FOB72_15405 [Cupriavidus pauculus]|uniref:Uncharacterized protein n=1 Tax=Cupriavidus pauculus TaxID=82633 RepID=A0A5P2H5G6_9BURK|nr:hypothetical protein [Cupriavidus pauculus]QET03301.1 hypothetical protein FOB72_15405 [Cupriavidus pauculus]
MANDDKAGHAVPAAAPATKDGEVLTWKKSAVMKIARAFAYHIPLYLIVITLLFIAMPKAVSNSLISALTGIPVADVAKSEKLDNIPSSGKVATAENGIKSPADPSENRTIVDVAKLALDGSKDKYDSIKDMYDKLFSVIAAMAALIAFLGFKGVDSFFAAKQKADDTVARAEEAQRKAEQSLSEVQDFIKRRYPADNRAELNVVTGMVMRHIADAYKAILDQCKPGHKFEEDKVFLECLDKAIYYLNAVDSREAVDDMVLKRAIITKGNIYRRMGQLEVAIRLLEELQQKYDIVDEVAVYNIACYSCLVAKKFADAGNSVQADKFILKSLDNLRFAIKMSEESKNEARIDADLAWFRDTKNHSYLAMLE